MAFPNIVRLQIHMNLNLGVHRRGNGKDCGLFGGRMHVRREWIARSPLIELLLAPGLAQSGKDKVQDQVLTFDQDVHKGP